MITAKIRPTLSQQFDPVNMAKQKKIVPYATGAYKKIDAECLNGKEKIGLIVNVESPNEFYVQINDFADDFKKIVTEMNEFYFRTVDEEFKLVDYNKGMPCAAQFSEDGVWYRAKVKSYSAKTRVVVAYFVDYGNEDVVSADEAKFLRNDFFYLPALAIRCRLCNVRPTSSDRTFTAEATKDLESFIGKPLAIHFVKMDEDQIWQVDLISETAGNSRNSICSRFVNKGYAEAYDSSVSTFDARKSLETSKKSSVVDLPDGFAVPNVSYDVEYLATLVYFRSLDDFYVTLTEDLDKLTQFQNKLSQIYGGHCVPPCTKTLPINYGCIANLRNTWCRCEIVELPNQNHQNSYRVLRVDYGDDGLLSVDSVYPIVDSDDDFISKTSRYTFCCKMKGVKMPKDFIERRELMKYFNELRDSRKFRIYGVDENHRFIVDLFLKNGSTLANYLLHAKLAEYDYPVVSTSVVNDPQKSPIQPMPKTLALARAEQQSPTFVEPPSSPVVQSGETVVQVASFPALKLSHAQNSYLDVFILNVESPSKFYVLLAEHSETFKKMETDLFRAYDNIASHIPLVTPVNGNLCVVKFSNEPRWCRCVVISRFSPCVVEVFLVDYGRTARVAKNDLMIMDGVFRNCPSFAVECSLKGVASNNRTSMEFKNFAENSSKPFVVRLDGKTADSTSFEVTLYDDEASGLVDLNKQLSRAGGRQRRISAREEIKLYEVPARQSRNSGGGRH